jgi:hypothetical protein
MIDSETLNYVLAGISIVATVFNFVQARELRYVRRSAAFAIKNVLDGTSEFIEEYESNRLRDEQSSFDLIMGLVRQLRTEAENWLILYWRWPKIPNKEESSLR